LIPVESLSIAPFLEKVLIAKPVTIPVVDGFVHNCDICKDIRELAEIIWVPPGLVKLIRLCWEKDVPEHGELIKVLLLMLILQYDVIWFIKIETLDGICNNICPSFGIE